MLMLIAHTDAFGLIQLHSAAAASAIRRALEFDVVWLWGAFLASFLAPEVSTCVCVCLCAHQTRGASCKGNAFKRPALRRQWRRSQSKLVSSLRRRARAATGSSQLISSLGVIECGAATAAVAVELSRVEQSRAEQSRAELRIGPRAKGRKAFAKFA